MCGSEVASPQHEKAQLSTLCSACTAQGFCTNVGYVRYLRLQLVYSTDCLD